jgi:hypothetical protein
MPVHMIVVEHDAISDPNSRQGESPFAGTGLFLYMIVLSILAQDVYQISVPFY